MCCCDDNYDDRTSTEKLRDSLEELITDNEQLTVELDQMKKSRSIIYSLICAHAHNTDNIQRRNDLIYVGNILGLNAYSYMAPEYSAERALQPGDPSPETLQQLEEETAKRKNMAVHLHETYMKTSQQGLLNNNES